MSRNKRARGRSPELQQLLDEATVAPVLPVQRMLPGQRAVREAPLRTGAVPGQRGSTQAGYGSGEPLSLGGRTSPGDEHPPAVGDHSPAVDGQTQTPDDTTTDTDPSIAEDPEPHHLSPLKQGLRKLALRPPDLPRRRTSSGRHTPRP